MTTERDAMLARIRSALKTASLPAALPTLPPRADPLRFDPATLAVDFVREVRAVAGTAHQPADRAAAARLTIELCRQAGAGPCLAWAEADLPLPGLRAQLCEAGFELLDTELPHEPGARRDVLARLGTAAVGVTGALSGLADTGSLVVHTGAGRPRLASLLAPVHVALLPVAALCPTMAHFYHAYPTLVNGGSNLVFITGPSRSADIELRLALGVHGPRELHVILVPSS